MDIATRDDCVMHGYDYKRLGSPVHLRTAVTVIVVSCVYVYAP